MIYELPTNVEVNGTMYAIRSDYRAILDICIALSDPELNEQEKALVALDVFYPGFDDMPPVDYEEALKQCAVFINCGKVDQGKKAPKLMDWEKDFQLIVSPINRLAGEDIRSVDYLHWWTFVSYYYEIGDCLFAHVMRIRSLKKKGKALDKLDREFYRENRDMIDLETRYTDAENTVLDMWTNQGGE